MWGVRSLVPVLLWHFVLTYCYQHRIVGLCAFIKAALGTGAGLDSVPLKASAPALFFVGLPNSLYSQSELLIALAKLACS
jgi:hypothetical protein